MKVRVFTGNRDASAYYRLLLPAKAVAAQGFDVARGEIGTIDADTDVAVIQRPARLVDLDVVKTLQDAGIAVMIDVDDDFDSLSPNHPFFQLYQTRRKFVHDACEAANLVTCSTPALLERYGYGHGICIRNYVSEKMLTVKPKERHEKLLLGWAGSLRAHPNDLLQIKPVLSQVLGPQWAFAQIGSPEGIREQLEFKGKFLQTGFIPFKEYPSVYASLDVAMVPLEPSIFNVAKSWLKGLEAASLGVPFVASSTPEYEYLSELGAGIVAHSRKDWIRSLTRLMRDEDYRDEQSRLVRAVASQLTIQKNWHRWLAAYQTAEQMLADGTVTISDREAAVSS